MMLKNNYLKLILKKFNIIFSKEVENKKQLFDILLQYTNNKIDVKEEENGIIITIPNTLKLILIILMKILKKN